MGVKIKKGDTILVISGKDRGRTAKVLKALPKEQKILVEGINVKQKHVRARRQGDVGQIVKVPAPLVVSNVKFLCSKCGKAVRLGYKIEQGKKYRICNKCKAEV